ncbi:hypothetical protein LshimejAT787_1702040 [Lyophyllum shimeji]|uniref:Integrase zinc-binding domain-containing protein n=1 Tax=Lyophyllum shimeji TaxID=47721 RepID=A0A9P3UTV9_LYOSH|nr:hypothetical protein LshimejAT787_1702040 [Lyophyllum shimeji]
MSPDRQRTLSCSSKPYSRPPTPDPPSKRHSVDIAKHESSQPTVVTSKPGFPTYGQYKVIEASYLETLTPNRREKALISQQLFDRIWAVLRSPDQTTESAQFRFWVRKKFAFGTIKHKSSAASDDSSKEDPDSAPGRTVLLHEKNLVAVQDQIYDILCYSHGASGHGGRDKTCLTVRQHYTWIPKELVARFIKACPTCIARKCGMPRNVGDPNATHNLLPTLRQYFRTLGTDDGGEDDRAADSRIYAPVPAAGVRSVTPTTMSEPSASPVPMSVDHSLLPTANHTPPIITSGPDAGLAPFPISACDNGLDRVSNHARTNRPAIGDSLAVTPSSMSEPSATPVPMSVVDISMDRVANHSAPIRPHAPRGHHMSREVSLYQGLPNGWQFRHDNVSAARDEFVLRQASWDAVAPAPRDTRPRIPSIVPMTHALPAPLATNSGTTPPLASHGVDTGLGLSASGPLPVPFQQNIETGRQDEDTLQIDPALLSPTSPARPATDNKTRPVPPASIVRAAAPPFINLESLSSQKSIQAFLTIRDTASLSPSSPQPQHPCLSPADSDSPHLLAFPMAVTDSLSPTNTVLLTPVDEVGPGIGIGFTDKATKELAKASSLMLNLSTEAVCGEHCAGVMVM